MRYATIRDLSRNPADVVKGRDPVVITRNGRPARLLIAFDEDMLLLNEPKVKASIAKSRTALARGDKGKTATELLAGLKASHR
jgi:PHD/YefM family antitoxin component YafN of YafNO toxin-antitoxin module